MKSSDFAIKNRAFPIPDRIISEKEYRDIMDALSDYKNFSSADKTYTDRLNNFTQAAKDMIRCNNDTIPVLGKTYYVSNGGDDNNDGLSPETAWATYKNPNSFEFSFGDAVLFRRGDIWRGMLNAKSGVSYSAYGAGPKPKLLAAYDGLADGEWLKTDKENIWVFSKAFSDIDIPVIVFNGGEKYASKKLSFDELKENLDFLYCSEFSVYPLENINIDNKVYMYCDAGNPADIFEEIEINMGNRIITSSTGSHDITYHNLELLYGTSPIWTEDSKNIRISYCICGWSGGRLWNKAKEKNNTRLGGGVCTWHGCDGISFDHCWFYEQYDSGVTPQFNWNGNDITAVFKNYKATDCIFEGCEWTFEYYCTQLNKDDNCFENFYFGYNICKKGGDGFGAKGIPSRIAESAYVKSWGHENTCFNCIIEHNIFDRAKALSIEIIGHDFLKHGKEVSYEHIPKLAKNIYIEPRDKEFANINHIIYRFNEATHTALEKLGVETKSIYMFEEEK